MDPFDYTPADEQLDEEQTGSQARRDIANSLRMVNETSDILRSIHGENDEKRIELQALEKQRNEMMELHVERELNRRRRLRAQRRINEEQRWDDQSNADPVEYTPGDEQRNEEEEPDNLDDFVNDVSGNDDWSVKWEKDQAKVHTVGGGPKVRQHPLFGKRYFEYKATTNLFDLLGLEDECKNPRFVKWLMDKKDFSVEQVLSNYKFEYYGYGENGAKPFRRFATIGGTMDGQEHITAITEIREYYDQYKKEELKKILKRAGIVTAVGVLLTSIVTGLALGLKRKGKDMVRNSEKPWSEIEGASGKGLIFIGDHIYLVIGGTLIYLYSR